MKKLISADTVRAAHAAGENIICVNAREHIVTPEARVVAERLGLILTEDNCAIPNCETPQTQTSSIQTGEDVPGDDVLAEIRARVLEQVPQGTVPSELLEQLVRKAAAEHQESAKTDASIVQSPSPHTPTIKCVRARDVKMGRFDGAAPGQNVGIADLITAADGSSMAAGLMQWENAFFPWTLNYDEVDLVLEGELHIRCGTETTVAKAGDVIFIPKGSNIEFGTPSQVRFLYVAYPANWQSC